MYLFFKVAKIKKPTVSYINVVKKQLSYLFLTTFFNFYIVLKLQAKVSPSNILNN